ncbi:hypothetical protein GT347_05255 [Xylophilus rhododendri]|uniref:Chemotaxis phosphatase CheX-like domain-containing protein n=1 Tax=Xylophilus rhododendri TaxID=2697032 RepID=A0A857J2I6_9BURK|nr:hypothetical protein [Xylophilus rhododendri]QHI97443.1 hypothetical protein GT347_05255 [Xylophilus rhododendri]
MISTSARDSLDRMVSLGLQNALPAPPGATVQVEPVDSLVPPAGAYMVVLMLASHTFRLVIAMYLPRDRATRDYLEQVGRLTPGDESEQALRDSVCESANMCCGTVNREIGRFYQQTGMSTPHIIDSRSAGYVQGLAHQHLRHFRVELGGTRVLATLCADARREMDFDWWPEAQPEVAGELEFF